MSKGCQSRFGLAQSLEPAEHYIDWRLMLQTQREILQEFPGLSESGYANALLGRFFRPEILCVARMPARTSPKVPRSFLRDGQCSILVANDLLLG